MASCLRCPDLGRNRSSCNHILFCFQFLHLVFEWQASCPRCVPSMSLGVPGSHIWSTCPPLHQLWGLPLGPIVCSWLPRPSAVSFLSSVGSWCYCLDCCFCYINTHTHNARRVLLLLPFFHHDTWKFAVVTLSTHIHQVPQFHAKTAVPLPSHGFTPVPSLHEEVWPRQGFPVLLGEPGRTGPPWARGVCSCSLVLSQAHSYAFVLRRRQLEPCRVRHTLYHCLLSWTSGCLPTGKSGSLDFCFSSLILWVWKV